MHPSPPDARATEARTRRELEALALVRTAFSSERSLLAWMRTSASLFAFGFSITKFFDYVGQREGTPIPEGPRRLGLALTCAGILALAPAVFEYLRRLRKMKELGLPPTSRYTLPAAVAAAILAIGVAAVVGIARHW